MYANASFAGSKNWKYKLGHLVKVNAFRLLLFITKGIRIREIAAGSNHSAVVSSSGELYTFGLGGDFKIYYFYKLLSYVGYVYFLEYGRLGHGDNVTQLIPKRVNYAFSIFH